MIVRLLIALIIPLAAARAQVSAPPLPETPAKSVPGLTLSFTSGGRSDARTARLVALHVPAGQPATPFLKPGAFTAKWEGEILSPLRADYTFAAELEGKFTLTINGQPVLDGAAPKKVQLNKGGNKFTAEYTSPASGDAFVRLMWSSKEFPSEPVPPMSFTRDPKAARAGERLREGRLLFAQLRCAACHADPALPVRGQGMPELAQDAPTFDDLGAKFHEPFLAAWINDPHAIRPRTLMPRVFPGEPGKIDQRAADLAAFLIAQGTPAEGKPIDAALAPAGGALFANLGCVGCHQKPDAEGKDEHDRIPLRHVRAKWQPAALREFLKEPAKNYAWIRMPHFRLTDEEASQLVAFLLTNAKQEFPAGPKGDAAKGAQLLVSAGCLNCHAALPPTTQPTLAATLKSGWTEGCMAPDTKARAAAPDFALTPAQRDSLLAFAAGGFDSLAQDTPLEFADRQAANLRCTACHSLDGEGSTWSKIDGETQALRAAAPQAEHVEGAPVPDAPIPALTWLGEKLRPDWMSEFIAGHGKAKPRPWLIGRMPGFATYAEGLAHGLSLQHGFGLTAAPEPALDTAKVKAGETLIGENGGFNCTTCHPVADRPATAVFEAPGTNLLAINERLRSGYYARWVLAPLRVDPETKMPQFADTDGKTPLTDFYEGKASEQIDAIWQYLRSLKK